MLSSLLYHTVGFFFFMKNFILQGQQRLSLETIHDEVSIQMEFYTQFLNDVNLLYYLCYFPRW